VQLVASGRRRHPELLRGSLEVNEEVVKLELVDLGSIELDEASRTCSSNARS